MYQSQSLYYLQVPVPLEEEEAAVGDELLPLEEEEDPEEDGLLVLDGLGVAVATGFD